MKRKAVDIPERKYQCDIPGCGSVLASNQNLKNHQRSHAGEKGFKCDFKDCNSAFVISGDLVNHTRIHTGEKPYKCDFKDCNSAFSSSSSLIKHKRIHSGEKPYKCDFRDCISAFSVSGSLTSHKRTHSREKPYKCDFKDCITAFSISHNLIQHKRIHSGEKPYKCDFKNCISAFSECGSLTKHKRMHNGEFTHFCTECGWPFRGSHNLKSHIEKTHSGKVKKFEKKEEKLVFDMLTKAGISFDCNVGIDYCDMSQGKKRAFLDFTIQTENGILILEVDEHEHGNKNLKPDDAIQETPKCEGDENSWGYTVSCEQRRMADVVAALRVDGETGAIGFLRYNPHRFKSDGHRMDFDARETVLLDFIHNWGSSEGEKQDFSIHYLFYDEYTVGQDIRCCLWEHKDFEPILQNCVYRVEYNNLL